MPINLQTRSVDILNDYSIPVSYTHLDVYKRQVVRLLAHYVQESVANRLGSAVKATFRERALEHMFKLGVQHKERHGDVIHMLTDGLEQVDAYVARYIPQILYAIMIPLIMGCLLYTSIVIRVKKKLFIHGIGFQFTRYLWMAMIFAVASLMKVKSVISR